MIVRFMQWGEPKGLFERRRGKDGPNWFMILRKDFSDKSTVKLILKRVPLVMDVLPDLQLGWTDRCRKVCHHILFTNTWRELSVTG